MFMITIPGHGLPKTSMKGWLSRRHTQEYVGRHHYLMKQNLHMPASWKHCEANPEGKPVDIISPFMILLCKSFLRASIPCFTFISICHQLCMQSGVILLQWLH